MTDNIVPTQVPGRGISDTIEIGGKHYAISSSAMRGDSDVICVTIGVADDDVSIEDLKDVPGWNFMVHRDTQDIGFTHYYFKKSGRAVAHFDRRPRLRPLPIGSDLVGWDRTSESPTPDFL